MACLDAFLYNFTILPLKAIFASVMLLWDVTRLRQLRYVPPAIDTPQWDFADFYYRGFQSAAFDQPQSHLTISSGHNTDDRAIHDDRREQDVSQGSRTRYDKALRYL
jgi:hypothetical protein